MFRTLPLSCISGSSLTDRELIPSQTVIGRFVQKAQLNPDRLSMRLIMPSAPDILMTYADLLKKSSQFANYLRNSGLKEGQTLVIVIMHSEELIYAFLGAMLCGAVPSIFAPPSVKIPPDVYRKTLDGLLDACDANYLITNQNLFEKKEAFHSTRPNLRILNTDEYKSCPDFLDQPLKENPHQIAFLQYSSGTTGLKKGVALSNDRILNQIDHYAATINLGIDDKIVSWLPLYHDMGLIACFILPLVSGVPVTLMSPFDWVADPLKLFKTIHKEKSTLCWMPNFAYDFMADNVSDTDGLSLESIKGFINCSEPIRHESHLKFTQAFKHLGITPHVLWTCYAMAENTFAVTQGGGPAPVMVDEIDSDHFTNKQKAIPASPSTLRRRLFVSSGKPLKNNQIHIANDLGMELPDRSVGEIVIASDSLFTEYFHQPDLTQATLKNGWFHTGDLGYMAEGHLFITGRKKDLMIVAGKNIYPQDIEEITASIEGVLPGRVVAFGVYNDDHGTEDVIVLAETNAEKASHVQMKLAIARAIREQTECTATDVVLLPHMWLVKSTSGKISRSGNRKKYLSEFGGKNVNQ